MAMRSQLHESDKEVSPAVHTVKISPIGDRDRFSAVHRERVRYQVLVRAVPRYPFGGGIHR